MILGKSSLIRNTNDDVEFVTVQVFWFQKP